MLFNSLAFPAFLVIVLTVHWWLERPRARQIWLLVASNVFYGWWDYRFLGLMWLSSSVDYLCGAALGRDLASRTRRWVLAASLTTNLVILGTFKYLGFFAESLKMALHTMGVDADWPTLHLVLPIGISFYTFHSMSYAIDVYRGRLRPFPDALTFFLFVSYFPQLVAGPIARAGDLAPQLDGRRPFDERQARIGMRCILWGFFLKSVVADNLALVANEAYSGLAGRSGADLLLGTYAFAFQIYGDFAGYYFIALGTSALFAVTLAPNFRMPYLAEDLREFWTRWHISLTSWFRDYFYVLVLGGSRVGPIRRVVNVLITFMVSGLWHGANWTFVLWGAINGAGYFIPRLFRGAGGWRRAANRVIAFHLVCLGWCFFRSPDVGYAFQVLRRIASASLLAAPALSTWTPALALLPAIVLLVEWVQSSRESLVDLDPLPRPARLAVYALMAGVVFFVGTFNRTPFIYFQF
jgi:D-alanyl-lipoteichoic acid acyltransferase DltB (MBOAT superfamily)